MDPRDELLALCADLRDEVEAWRAVGWERLPVGAPPALGEAPRWEGTPALPPRPAASAPRAPSSVAPARPPAASPPAPPVAAPATRPAPPPAAGIPNPAPPSSPGLGAPAVPGLFGAPVAPGLFGAPAAPGLFGAPPADAAGGGLFGGRWGAVLADPQEGLRALAAEAEACTACGRCGGRRATVFGGGAVRGLLVLAPSPSAGEDAEGRPFVGEAGAMFDRMLVNVLALERADVHVAPVVLCAGAEPLPSELAACRAWLDRRLALVEPRVVLVMGRPVARVLGLDAPAGVWQRWGGKEALVTAHPEEIQREPALRRDVFEHLKEVRRRLG